MNSTYIRIRSFEITWFQKSFYFMLKNSHASVYCTLTYSPQQLWFSFFSLCPSITPLSPWQFHFSGSILQTYLILYTCVKSRNRKWRKMNIICSSNTGWNGKKFFFKLNWSMEALLERDESVPRWLLLRLKHSFEDEQCSML